MDLLGLVPTVVRMLTSNCTGTIFHYLSSVRLQQENNH